MTRSEVMSRVKSKNTNPELFVRRIFWKSGLRYRIHDRTLPGRPDLVFKNRKIVVFVHGCFWHGHVGCKKHRIPKSRSDWWREKIDRNAARDTTHIAELKKMGWKTFVIWECQLEAKSCMKATLEPIIKKINRANII